MAIVITLNDSIFDVLNMLQNNGFEICSFIFSKSRSSFGIKVILDERFVKICNYGTDLVIMSNFDYALTTDKVRLSDDLSYEELK